MKTYDIFEQNHMIDYVEIDSKKGKAILIHKSQWQGGDEEPLADSTPQKTVIDISNETDVEAKIKDAIFELSGKEVLKLIPNN